MALEEVWGDVKINSSRYGRECWIWDMIIGSDSRSDDGLDVR